MTDKKDAELLMIESNIVVDTEQKKVQFRYPLLRDAHLLHNNQSQAIGYEAKVEKRLTKEGLLEAYNDEIQGCIDGGVFRELGAPEMEEWSGAVNYIAHHGVLKPQSHSTAL